MEIIYSLQNNGQHFVLLVFYMICIIIFIIIFPHIIFHYFSIFQRTSKKVSFFIIQDCFDYFSEQQA